MEKILKTALTSCKYDRPNYIVSVFQSLRSVCDFWKIIFDSSKFRAILPRVYIPYQEILPKSKANKSIRVNMQRVIKTAGSFSGISIELKTILNHPQWHTAWLNLSLLAYGWYLIEKIQLRFKE